MDAKRIEDAKDQDLAKSFQAMRRAAQRARELAAQTGTDLIVLRDGKITRVPVPQTAAKAHR